MFKSRSKPAPQRRAASTSVPARTQAAPPAPAAQQSGGGMLSGIGSTIAQGMAFGTGSAIAHRAVGAAANAMTGGSADEVPREQMMAPEVAAPQETQLSGPCASDKEMFFDCLKVNQGDQQACSFLYDALKTCQVNSTQMS